MNIRKVATSPGKKPENLTRFFRGFKVALKVSQAAILLRTQIQAALEACSPERGITDWLNKIADDIEYPRSSLSYLYYGNSVNLPKGPALYALLAHKSLGRRFLNCLLQPVVPCAAASASDLSAPIAAAEALVDVLKATQPAVVPIARRRA